jgi:GxxExxY protein
MPLGGLCVFSTLRSLRETQILLLKIYFYITNNLVQNHMNENEISYKIIGVAIELHRNIGPGLLESVYENALAYDLRQSGLIVRQQVAMPFIYKEVHMEMGYRLDLLVNEKVIIEVKAVETLAPVHYAQTLTYLRLAEKKLGYS